MKRKSKARNDYNDALHHHRLRGNANLHVAKLV